MKVLLAGATGAIGLPLTRRLIAHGHEVIGLSRTPNGAEPLRQLGAQLVVADVLDREYLLRALNDIRADAVIHELTALKRIPLRHRNMALTNTLRTTGTAHLIEAARVVGAHRFIVQSFFAGYGYFDHGPHLLGEDDPFGLPSHDAFAPHVAAMLAAEEQAFIATGLDGIALRYASFYGPGATLPQLVTQLRRRSLPIPSDGGGVLSWVYIDDAAEATVAALERGRAGQAYNIADDEPVSWRAFLSAIAETFGTPFPPELPRTLLRVMQPVAPVPYALLTESIRISNAKAKRELGWILSAPTYREGIARAFAELSARTPDDEQLGQGEAVQRLAVP